VTDLGFAVAWDRPGREVDVHVVVVGCGRVGSGLAEALEAAGHSVAVVDRRAESFRRLPESFGGARVVGVGFDRQRLEEAGISRADALAAVTSGDNSNIVVARVAREAFGLERVVARIYDPRRAAIYERLGITTVASVRWSIDRVLRHLLPDAPSVEWVDPSARVLLVERELPPAWAGTRAEALELPGVTRPVAVARFGEGLLVTPALVLQDGDTVWVSVTGEGVADLDRHLADGPTKGGH
jgi:trk system potassium uptake protein